MTKPLPTSTASFRKIIEGDYLYIDKTKYIYQLAQNATGAWFLSRPRRFGKSMFISMLQEMFQGHSDLFEGLWIESSDYTWDEHAVVRLDFNLYPSATAEELQQNMKRYLALNARRHGITLDDGPHYAQFGDLIMALAAEKPVVILIDEYDKPLIDNLQNQAEAKKILSTLKGFYGIIKALDEYIRMSFITGISKFSKVGIFSDLNNLTDLTMHPLYATAFGFTEEEIRRNLGEYIDLFAQKEGISSEEFIQKMRHWYNGFCFTPDGKNVYNPFSTMHLFFNQRFSNYWFESGSPSFLIKQIMDGNYDVEELSNQKLGELSLSTFEIGHLDLIPLLVQTGYMTIKEYFPDSQRYLLDYPNFEVENAFMIHLLDAFSNSDTGLSEAHLWRMIDALHEHNLDEFFDVLQILFANIDYDLHLDFEKYYQTIFYLLFQLLGLRIDAEAKTNIGRIDAVIELEERIYIFEFKLNKSAQDALNQLKAQSYYQKYQGSNKPITCVGANFSTEKRNLDGWTKAKPEEL